MSLTSVVGKLLKRIPRYRTYPHLERQGLIRDSQHGFEPGKQCPINVIEFCLKTWRGGSTGGKVVDNIYMDHNKISYTVLHARLVQKVRSRMCYPTKYKIGLVVGTRVWLWRIVF